VRSVHAIDLVVKNAWPVEARKQLGMFELSSHVPINQTPVVPGFLLHTHYID